MIMAILAVACGGGGSETADGGGVPNFDGSGSDDTVPVEIATTAPVLLPDAADTTAETSEEEAAIESTEGMPDEVEDPWLVHVLHVNDDVQIVPTFDAPNGNQTKIYDVNEIDGVEWEYPLLAETHFKNRLALLVDEFDSTEAWAKVFVPVRPNGTTVWVQTAFFTVESHNYHITIDLSENTVQVYQGETPLFETPETAVMGKPSRPTPVLRSYIDEKIPGGSLSPAYGDWVLSIAAFSEALGTFGGGGMPKLALHGTNQPELMGQYVSSGCVRIPNAVVDFIAQTVPVGTVVDIVE